MELKTIFQMTKTDRYTQDGRDELAKLQETEDVKYKTGDISQKTGLQKQPDGSWAPPKNAGKNVHGAEIDKIYEKHQKRIKELKAKGYTDEQIENDKIYQQTKEDMRNVGKSKPAGSINRTPERIAKETAIMEALNLSTGEDNNLHKMSDETIERLYAKTKEKPAAGSKPDAAKEIAEHREAAQYYKRKARSFSETDPSYSTYMKKAEEYENKAKELEGNKPAEKPTDKYKDLPGAQKKDALFASTFEGIPIGQTQNQMERQGWDLVQADDDVNVYAKPDGSKVTMKHDGQKITSSEYEAPGSNEYIAQQKALEQEGLESTPEGRRILHMLDKGDIPDYFKSVTTKKDLDVLRQQAEERMPDPSEFDQPGKRDEYIKLNNLLNKIDRVYNKTRDAAPRELTGDCKIKIRPQTQDVKYNTGDISQKTGLQKQPDGSWAPPKKQGRTFQFEVGENGQAKPGTGKEVKTYRTKKEAQEALKTFNKMTGSNKADFESVKSEYNKALEKNTGRSAAESKPAAAPKLNQVEKVDNTNRPYRIKGTQFYFETPEEAETAIVAGTRGEGKTYAKPSSDPTINEIQNALGFKLDSEYAGKYSMDDFIKKTGEDEYAVKVWSFGTNSKGTLIDTIVEGYNEPDATIKKENGEWRLHYTDRDGKKMIVTPEGREWPTSDSAPRQLTGDTRIRVKK